MNLNAEVKKQLFKTFEILKTTLSVDQIPEILSLTSYSVYAEFDAVKTVSSTGENEILKYFQDFVQRHNLIWVNAPVLKAAAHSFSDILRSLITFYGECTSTDEFGRQIVGLLQEWVGLNPSSLGSFYSSSESVIALFQALIGDCSDAVLYDGACGIGMIANRLNPKKAILRDINQTVVGITALLFKMSNIDVDLQVADTLTHNETSYNVDIVASTPPFGLRIQSQLVENTAYIRDIHLGKSIPSSASESLWIQQALYQLNDTGRAFLQIIPGWLFRGGYDAALREKLIEKDWVEAVIQLPEKLLSNTNIETVLLVLNKAKDTNGVVRFVDARTLGQRTRSQTTLMLEDITLIRNLVMGIETDSQLSQTISLQQIKENKYNLHCNEYFASEIEETKLDLKAESDKLIQAQLEYEKAQQIFNQILSEV